MKRQNYLIPRFPGGKRDHKKYRIWDGARYDAVIEPFAGGSAFSQQMILRGCKNIFLGECDRLLLPIYRCWLNPESHQAVYDEIQNWQKRFHEATYSHAKFDLVWDCLKQLLNKEPLSRESDYPIAERAAASLVLRKLTFGGVVRLNTQGMLNVKWVNDTIPGFLRWSYRFPHIPDDCNITIVNSWQKCVSRFHDWAEANPEGRAISLVDPPYFANLPSQEAMDKRKQQNGITPAYPKHEPHNSKTLRLSVDPVKCLLEFDQIKRLVVTNYYSDQLDCLMGMLDPTFSSLDIGYEHLATAVVSVLSGMFGKNDFTPVIKALESFIERVEESHRFRVVGKLDGLNMSRSSSTEYYEALWEFGELHQKQMSLFAPVEEVKELEPCLV